MSSLIETDAFRDACAQFATGVTIATVLAPDESPHGLTVSSFTSVSIHPPLILICIDYACTILTHFRQNPFFAVNILSEKQRALSVIFSVKPEGRFEGVRWYPGAEGSPLIADSLAHFECRTERILEAGDHAVLIAGVMRIQTFPGEPLLYFNRSYRSLA
jgi:flavin reductase (DIM6/NTAB) family NADH-FMN oxidoreductase RutF